MNKLFEYIELSEAISTLKGYAFKSREYIDSGIPVVRVSDFTDNSISLIDLVFYPIEKGEQHSKYKIKVEDILIQTVGSWPSNPASVVGKVIKVPKELDGALLNQNIVKIIPNKNISSKYLYYQLKCDTFKNYIVNCAQGAASQASITLEAIKKYKFELPSISTQIQIASILSTYDDLIENNNRRIIILEQSAVQIYKEWFVRKRFPNHENEHFDKGVPKDWAITYFRDFIKLNRGFDLPNDNIVEGKYPVVASTSIKAYHNQYKVEAPCVTTGRSGSLGTVQYVNKQAWPLNTSLYVKDFKGNSPIYVYYFLKSMKLENFNSGAGVPTLNQNHLHTLKFALPTKTIQKKFEEIINPIFQEIDLLKEKNQNLKQTRDLLLPRLISGKLQVKEVKKEIDNKKLPK